MEEVMFKSADAWVASVQGRSEAGHDLHPNDSARLRAFGVMDYTTDQWLLLPRSVSGAKAAAEIVGIEAVL